MHCNKMRQQGFTLLEVLLGTSLLSVMLLLLFGSLRICIQNWDAGERKIAQVNQMAVVQRFFNTHLQGIRPLQDKFSYDEPVFSFQGTVDRLQFVTGMPASAGRMGLQLFVIGLAPGDRKEGLNMTVSITPFFPLMEGKEWKNEEVIILDGVRNVQFSYFGAEESDEEPVWRNQWAEMEKLPLLVGVTIEMMDGEVWPDIVVAPRNEPDLPTTGLFNRRSAPGATR